MAGLFVAYLTAAFAWALLPVYLLRKYALKWRKSQQRERTSLFNRLGIGLDDIHKKRIVGFFHPYCNAGGGGERVLWAAVALIQREYPDIISIVYSGDTDASKEDIIQKAKARFDIELSSNTLHIVYLHKRNWVEDASWPRFTLLGQSIGSMFLGWEAINKLVPDLFIDTMGYAFTFPIVTILSVLAGRKVPVGAYVHYPTISTTMLSRVSSRTEGHTNSAVVASSGTLSKSKIIYYRLFMYLYAGCLRQASFLMVNSSWTKAHIDSILTHSDPIAFAVFSASNVLVPSILILRSLLPRSPAPRSARIVYPSCNTKDMEALPLEGRLPIVLSIAQFRPEKDHAKQIRSVAKLLHDHPELVREPNAIRLVLVGGARNASDVARVDSLRALVHDLGIEDRVEFKINAAYSDMLSLLGRASIGLSTMVDEHFGINVVEFLAAGVIPITHTSGGPLNDIVVPVNGRPTGYHATDVADFAHALYTVLNLRPDQAQDMRLRGRQWAVSKFSTEEFEKGWEESGWKRWL